MKKILRRGLSILMSATILMSSGLMMTSVSAATKNGKYVFGDVSNDGRFTEHDLFVFNDYLNGHDYISYTDRELLCVADVNTDEIIDRKDLNLLIRDFVISDTNLGDVNGDGRMNVLDIAATQRYLVSDSSSLIKSYSAADIDGNGSVNILDACQAQKILAGISDKSDDYRDIDLLQIKDKIYKEKYVKDIEYIETHTNISFEKLFSNCIYVVEKPSSYIDESDIFVCDNHFYYRITPDGKIWICNLVERYPSNTCIIRSSLCGYDVTGVDRNFSKSLFFEDYHYEHVKGRIRTIIIPDSDMIFSQYCFSNFPCLTEVVIQDGIGSEQFRGYNFANCKDIHVIAWSSSMTSIPEGFLSGCSHAEHILHYLPEHITQIDDYAFAGGDLEGSIEIPENITCIGDYIFLDTDINKIYLMSRSEALEFSDLSFLTRKLGDPTYRAIAISGFRNSGYEKFANRWIWLENEVNNSGVHPESLLFYCSFFD